MNDASGPSSDEDPLERALRRGLRRSPLSTEVFARLRRNLDPEFRRLTRQARRRRVLAWGAIAATLAVLSVLTLSLLQPPHPGMVVARIEWLDGDGLRVRDGLLSARTLTKVSELHAGERWVARGSVLLTLASGATMRLAPGATLEARRADAMRLLAGRVYLDFTRGAAPFALQTDDGRIEHVGTQFEVAILDARTRVRVREGVVRVSWPHGVESVSRGTEMMFSSSGAIDRHTIPTYGKDWEWVEAIAPAYAIENKPLMDFLQWVARETGRRVEFADARAREVAARTILHGSVEGLTPLEALEHVLTATSLRSELQGDAIHISPR